MELILPKGEKVRQAVKWISEAHQEEAGRSLDRLIEEAAARFNLSPKEEDFLRSFYKDAPRG